MDRIGNFMARIVTSPAAAKRLLLIGIASLLALLLNASNVSLTFAFGDSAENTQPPATEIYINEVYFNGDGSANDQDWIELVNLGITQDENFGDYYLCVQIQCEKIKTFYGDDPNPPYEDFAPGDVLVFYWDSDIPKKDVTVALYTHYPNVFDEAQFKDVMVDFLFWDTDVSDVPYFANYALEANKGTVLEVDYKKVKDDESISRVETPYRAAQAGTVDPTTDEPLPMFSVQTWSELNHNPGYGPYVRLTRPHDGREFEIGNDIPFAFFFFNLDQNFEFGDDEILKLYMNGDYLATFAEGDYPSAVFNEDMFAEFAALEAGVYDLQLKLETNGTLATDVVIPDDVASFTVIDPNPVTPTETPEPAPTDAPPTETPEPTATDVPPTETPEPTATDVPPTEEPTVVPPTETPATVVPTDEPVESPVSDAPPIAESNVEPTATNTVEPTATDVPPTETPEPTATEVPATETPEPTATDVPPTETPAPTATDVPPTETPEPIPTFQVDTDGLSFEAECPEGENACRDTDKDGIPDWADADDEDDGLDTALENPDPNGDGDPSDAQDTDKDGTPDYLDSDDDGNGVDTIVEVNAPNDGDGNNDGTPDALQNNVASLTTAEDDEEYVTVEFEGTCEDLVVDNTLREDEVVRDDEDYDYPFGLIDYRLGCGETGGESEVTLILHDVSDPEGLVLRKFGPTEPNGPVTDWYEYDAEFDTIEIDGKTVVTVTFTLQDGMFGDDTAADGIIYDPLGIGVSTGDNPTATPTATNTATPTFTPQAGSNPTATNTATPTFTPQAGATATNTATPTFTPPVGATATNTATATFTPQAGVATNTATPTQVSNQTTSAATSTPVAVAQTNNVINDNTVVTANLEAPNTATPVPTPTPATAPQLLVDVRSNAAIGRVGSDLVYTISLSNQGNEPADDVVVRSELSPQLDYIGGFSEKGKVSYDSATREIVAELDTLGVAQTIEIRVTVKVNETATAGVAIDSFALVASADTTTEIRSNVAGVQIIPDALPETGFFNPMMFIIAGIAALIVGVVGVFMMFGGAVSSVTKQR